MASVLIRHKKKGYEGFAYFVKFIEALSPLKQKDFLENGMLEDPIYIGWVLKNMMSIKFLSGLETEELVKLEQNLPNFFEHLYYAMVKDPDGLDPVEDILPLGMFKNFKEVCEYLTPADKSKSLASASAIIVKIRDLQDRGLIKEFYWKYPPKDIAFEKKDTERTGQYKLVYPNGEIALTGMVERTLRTGEWLHFYENGEMMARGYYEEGEKTGEWKFYYSNGRQKSRGLYVDNLKEGEWETWNAKGEKSLVHYIRGRKEKTKSAA
jgi:hypothetical protein